MAQTRDKYTQMLYFQGVRMRTTLKLLIAAFILIGQSTLAGEEKPFKPVNDLFLAMSQVDHKKMKAEVTDDFLLLEHGEVWKIDDLIKVVKPSEYKRTNYFSIINIRFKTDIAWINYWNKANFDNGKNSEDIVWLESAVVVKDSGVWKLEQMHSTRLDPTKVSKNIVFIRQ